MIISERMLIYVYKVEKNDAYIGKIPPQPMNNNMLGKDAYSLEEKL